MRRSSPRRRLRTAGWPRRHRGCWESGSGRLGSYRCPRLPDACDLLAQAVEQLARDAAAVGAAELNFFLVRAVEVAPAGLDQAVAVGELRVFFDVRRAVIA